MQIKGILNARDIKQISNFDASNDSHMKALDGLGLDFTDKSATGMDAFQGGFTTGSANSPISLLRSYLPGVVKEVTQVRKIDELLGQVTIGDWADEEIVQRVQERTSFTKPYGDNVDIPLANSNYNFERRTVVRFVNGFRSDLLADMRAAKAGFDGETSKRQAALIGLEIVRNEIGFSGYNGGSNLTYGFLNDPNLPAYVTLPNGAAGSSTWETKTYLEKIRDIDSALDVLTVQSGGNIDPTMTQITWAIPLGKVGTITETNDFGKSVKTYLKDNWPNVRTVVVPELDSANGGADVFYLYAENIGADSTDNGRVFDQLVPNKLMNIGTNQKIGGYEEGFSNAMAGTLLKRPWGVVRRTGM